MLMIMWFLFMISTGVLAARKNRNWPLWSVFGLIGGFFAFVVLIMVRYLCPHCGKAFAEGSDNGVHCGHCGKRDRLTPEDEARLNEIRTVLSARGLRLKAKGIRFSVEEEMGVLEFLGMDALEKFVGQKQQAPSRSEAALQ